jgi:hypothetical protein
MTKVVNIRKVNLNRRGYQNLEEWLKDENHVYIGRNMSQWVKGAKRSKWANPYSVKTFGRKNCMKKYLDYLRSNKELLNSIGELKGKELGCWCYPEPCHGDILVSLVKEIEEIERIENEYSDEEIEGGDESNDSDENNKSEEEKK